MAEPFDVNKARAELSPTGRVPNSELVAALDEIDRLNALLVAHRAEFAGQCRREDFTEAEARACLQAFEEESLFAAGAPE